jgi:hypothetical protein
MVSVFFLLIGHLYIFFGEISISIFCLFGSCVVYLFIYLNHRLVRVLYIFWIPILYQVYNLQTFSPILWALFFLLFNFLSQVFALEPRLALNL